MARLCLCAKGGIALPSTNQENTIIPNRSNTAYTSPLVERNAVIDAAFTMGDRASDVKAIAVHSAVYSTIAKNNEIEFIRDADNNILFATYAGMAILQDDNLVLAGGNYLTVLFAQGAVAYA